MAHYLLRHEGLFVGPSAALNVVGAIKAARLVPPGATVATVLCDGGERYRGRTFNAAWLHEKGLTPRAACARGDLSFVDPDGFIWGTPAGTSGGTTETMEEGTAEEGGTAEGTTEGLTDGMVAKNTGSY